MTLNKSHEASLNVYSKSAFGLIFFCSKISIIMHFFLEIRVSCSTLFGLSNFLSGTCPVVWGVIRYEPWKQVKLVLYLVCRSPIFVRYLCQIQLVCPSGKYQNFQTFWFTLDIFLLNVSCTGLDFTTIPFLLRCVLELGITLFLSLII